MMFQIATFSLSAFLFFGFAWIVFGYIWKTKNTVKTTGFLYFLSCFTYLFIMFVIDLFSREKNIFTEQSFVYFAVPTCLLIYLLGRDGGFNSAINDFKEIKNFTISKISLSNLNSPIKRVGGVILFIGIGLLIMGLIQIMTTQEYRILKSYWNAFTLDRFYYRQYWLAAWGTYLTVFGLSLSYFYDQGIGRLISWIRTG